MTDLHMNLEASPDAAQEARLAIKRDLGDVLPAPVLYDLMLTVTELVENSVNHGSGGPIQVRVSDNGDGMIHGEVEEDRPPEPVLADLSADLETGLGLRIVDAICEGWGADGNAVWFRLRVA